MRTPLNPNGGSNPTFTDHLDRMFGTGERLFKDEPHVQVWRRADGGVRYFDKRYLRFRDERNQDIDLRFWTDREEQMLAALNAGRLGLKHVQVFKSRGQSADRSERQLETWDAGPDGDQWQQVPVARNGARLPHLFVDCAHWFGLARWLLAALDEVHSLGFVHVDLKGDNFCLPAQSIGEAGDGYPERVRLRWSELKLIDFAFSVWEKRLPLEDDMPLPIGRSAFRYQSEQLLAALAAGNSPAPDLGPTRGLDWQVDLYSLGFLLGQILREAEKRCLPEDGNWGWTEKRHGQARQLIDSLQSWDREWRRPAPIVRPHRALIELLDRLLGEDDLAASLTQDWQIVRDANWRLQDASVRTPPTVPALRRRVEKAGADSPGPTPISAPERRDEVRSPVPEPAPAPSPTSPPPRSWWFVLGPIAGTLLGAGVIALWPKEQPAPPLVRSEPALSAPVATPAAADPRAYLTVRATPASAQIRIMNIGPAYRDGIELAPGDFDLQVSAPGYQTYRAWHTVAAGVREVAVTLQPDPAAVPASGMVRLPAGCFQMGSPESETGRDSDERPHRVCVETFEIGQREVTVGEFKRFAQVTGYQTDAERDAGRGCYALNATGNKWDWRKGLSWRKPGYEQKDTHPVVCVSWNDANRYADWLSKQTGQAYRLPTEAEWEYAERAGTTTARYWGDDPNLACRYANVADQTQSPAGNTWTVKHDCSDGYWYPAPVGSYQPNGWKLYDMLGNVREWTCSAYDKEYGGAEQRCTEKDTTVPLAVRGGGWFDEPPWVRSADRFGDTPAFRYFNRGVRLARSL